MPDLESMSNEELLDIATKGMSNKQLLEIAMKKQPVKSFTGKAIDVAKGSLAGFTNFIEPEKVGQTAIDTLATSAIPVTDREAFRTTPLLETAGSMAGALPGIATGNIPLAIAGGGGGAGLGRAGDEFLRKLLGVSDVEDIGDFGKKVAVSAALGAGGEAVPAVLQPLAKRGIAPFASSMSKRAKDALRFSRQHGDIVEDVFGRKNVMPFLPSEGTDITPTSSFAKLLDVSQNMIEKSIFGGGPIASRRIGNAKVNEIILRKTLDAIDIADLGPTGLGTLLRNAAEGNLKGLNGIINRRYTAVNNLVKDLRTTIKLAKTSPNFRPSREVGIIRMIQPKRFAKEVSELGRKVNGIGDTEQGFKIADKLLGLLKNDRGHVDYETAQLLRSTYATKLRNREIAKETGPINMRLKSLIKKIDSSIETSLGKHSPEALKKWLGAKDLRLKMGKKFQNDLITKLLDTAPNQSMISAKDFVDGFLGTGDSLDVEKIRTIKAAVGPKAWQKAKRFITQKMLLESAEPGISQVAVSSGQLGKTTGEGLQLKSELLEGALLGKRGMGKEVLKEIYTTEEIVTLKGVANSLAVAQAKQADGTGGMFIQLTQGGAVLGVGGFKKAATVLMLPPVVARIFLNPTTAKWLTEGLTAPEGSRLLITSFGKISAFIANLEAQERSRKLKTTNPRLFNQTQRR
jgi:hypothetical protein